MDEKDIRVGNLIEYQENGTVILISARNTHLHI